MYGVLVFLHLLVSLLLILSVLIQQPQKGGLGTLLGGGESIFGGGGAAPFMAKVTTALAVAFMLTSLGIVLTSSSRTSQQRGASAGNKHLTVAAVHLEHPDVRDS